MNTLCCKIQRSLPFKENPPSTIARFLASNNDV